MPSEINKKNVNKATSQATTRHEWIKNVIRWSSNKVAEKHLHWGQGRNNTNLYYNSIIPCGQK